MKTIKYYYEADRYMLVDVADGEFADKYQEFQREEWRRAKKEQAERNMSLSLNADLGDGNELDSIIGCGEAIDVATQKKKDAKLKRAAMARVIAELSEKQRDVLRLLMQGVSEVDIALHFGVSKQAIHNLKKKLQKKFEEFLC